MLAITGRELSAIFFSSIAYWVAYHFLLVAGFFFVFTVLRPGQPAELGSLFLTVFLVLIAVCPAIGMRLISEELRSGTIEPLLTAPVSDASVIIGKWLASWVFLVMLLAPTVVFVAMLEAWGEPDYGPILAGYAGLVLCGGLFLAISIFTSTLSRDEITAFNLALLILEVLTIATYILARTLPANIATVADYMNAREHYKDFTRGLVDAGDIVYFLSGIVLFLVLAIKTLESRKWR